MTNATSTSTARAALTGAALIAHDAAAQRRGLSRADAALNAGYVRPDGSPAFTAFYEALITARSIAEGPSGLPRSPRAVLTLTDSSGQPLPIASPSLELDRQGWADSATYTEAWIWLQNLPAGILPNVGRREQITATITDRAGCYSLATYELPPYGSDPRWFLSDGFIVCDRCEAIEWHDDAPEVITDNGRQTWCNDCADDHASRCDDCNEYTAHDALIRTGNSRDVCPECIEHAYGTCEDCGDLYEYDDMETVDESETVCRHCLESGEGRRYHYHPGEGWRSEPPEDDDDDDEHQGPGMRRYGYHTDANDTLNHSIPNTGHTYGAEMEYKGEPDNWQAVTAACHRRAILTNDSTVSGELVSVALTAGQLRRWLAATADALAGTHNDNQTGCHFHVDRRALSPWQWFTLTHYTKEHADTLETIAGRTANQWSDLRNLPAESWPQFARNWKYRSWPSRYTGVNLSKGPTVEIRVCRATKTKSQALARFGMVQRMVALGRLAPSQRPQSAEELRGWLAQDANIRAVTGWEPGPYNYREACQKPPVEGDEQPTPPSPEAIQSLCDRIRRLTEDHNLTDDLRYNARRRYAQGPADDRTYGRSALAIWEHYRRETERIGALLNQARAELDCAQSLASIGTLTR